MKATFASCVLIALLSQFGTAPVTAGKIKTEATTTALSDNVAASRPPRPEKGNELAALEQKLHGTWKGGACVGDYTLQPDGTFELKHFTPGNNTLTGIWSIRWDALPPTLVLTCQTSDFRKKDPSRPEYEQLGKTLEPKLLELNSDVLVYRFPNDKQEWRFSRPKEDGG